ncbi:DUF11 domain-containing protein [Terrisporobacter sp.]|uniref:DUF11 domain-containing protein n=1 Tax=Terrisporobacter sp. TaxID=1965305 RepID=UPI0026280DEF|nr:DUF11 domain-containing protein [Terrisporobacter sp.]
MSDTMSFNSQNINNESNTCAPNCDDNCRIKNMAFLQYQYGPTATSESSNIDKSARSGVVSVCLENKRNAKFKMFKISSKEATEPGDIIQYRVAVANTGDVPLNGVKLVDIIDSDTTYVANSASVVRAVSGVDTPVPFTPSYVNVAKTLTITADQVLPVGEMFIFSYKVSVSSTLSNPIIKNNATITTTTQGATSPQKGSVEIPIRYARVGIAKSISPAYTRCVKCGDSLTYKITLTHSGTVPATNLVVTDLFDPEFCFDADDVVVKNKAGATVGSPTVTKTVTNGLLTVKITTLPVGEVYTITISGEICCC